VEDEQWNPAEVSPSLQRITDVLVDSAVRDSPELVIKSDTDTLFPSSNGMANGTANPIPNTNGKGKGKGRGTTPPPASRQASAKRLQSRIGCRVQTPAHRRADVFRGVRDGRGARAAPGLPARGGELIAINDGHDGTRD